MDERALKELELLGVARLYRLDEARAAAVTPPPAEGAGIAMDVLGWDELRARLAGRTFWKLTKHAARPVWEATFERGDVLVFGSETRGLPARILDEDPQRNLTLPMRPEVRSLPSTDEILHAIQACDR